MPKDIKNNSATPQKDPDVSTQQVVVKAESGRSKGCLISLLIFIFLFLIVCSCSVGSLTLLALSETNGSEIIQDGSEDVVALIRVEGVISSSEQQSLFGGSIGSSEKSLVEQLERASNDPAVKAILLGIESPGGEAVASDIVARKVLEIRKEKPIVAYSATMAASGGYMIASAADQFVVHPGDLTGSIGVIMQTSSLEGLYEKLGIDSVTIKSDRFKDNADLFENPEGELYQVYQGIIDESYEQFVEIIVEGRGMDEGLVRELGDGRLYSGKQAVANGLADSEGYFEDALVITENLAGVSNATVVDYSTDYYWLDLFSSTQIHHFLRSKTGNDSFVGVYYLPDITR